MNDNINQMVDIVAHTVPRVFTDCAKEVFEGRDSLYL